MQELDVQFESKTLYEKFSIVHSNRQKKSGVIFRKDLKGFVIYIKF